MLKSDQSALLNIFHDGTFLSLQKEAENIIFRVEIQYLAAMIDPTYTYFTGVLKNCQQFLFQPWENKNKRYKDINMISALLIDMEISNASFERDRVLVHCLSEKREQVGGSLIFSCESIIIFDGGQREVAFSELQDISRRYWTGGSFQWLR